jgi:hypothetical protein
MPIAEQRREQFRLAARELAVTADRIAAVLEELARVRDKLADLMGTDPEPWNRSAGRARDFAARERREADRLRRASTPTPSV